jgi:hypothetical protein
MTPGYIYIFTGESFLKERKFKIGKTINPTSRLSALCTSCPDGRFIGVFPCKNMDKVEAFIHKDIKDKKWEKEWFFFDTGALAVEYVQSRLPRYDDDAGERPAEWSPEAFKESKAKSAIAGKKTAVDKLIADCKTKSDKLEAHLTKSAVDEDKICAKIEILKADLAKKKLTNATKAQEMRIVLELAMKKHEEVTKNDTFGMLMGVINTLFKRTC